ncbi:PEP-CTERM sorting domain-containing protein [Luteolibacter ambystomatis]|uniref:PEP-CTERM sorting domain-containing protein n=1 Tax=Luteolibacter ambystomatis TaxID=2824561 RepID=A0A975PEU3_9BACT|nr:PEP-CTERM sorting domain-containing protein [Luteolibacter ambystomatis]QUE51653.1 PEP-CTERM sorting domain-containing protein [Luteolibacter ambystomatis]
MKTKLLLGVAAIALALVSGRVNAQTLQAHLIDANPQVLVNVTFDGNPAHGELQNAGQLNFDFGPAFCVEPLAGLSYGENLVYNIQNPLSLTQYDTISRLVGGYLASGQTNVDAAGVQAAIWEIVMGDNGSLSSGNVRLLDSPAVVAAANNYLANVNTYTPVALTYLTNDTRQDVVTWAVVPEPSSVLLIGLASVGLLRRKR